MSTTITRLKGRIEADVPVLTHYGIEECSYTGVYVNRMRKAGHTLSSSELAAVREFFLMGRRWGWLDKLLYVLPFCGTKSGPESALVPLLDRFHHGEGVGVGVSGKELYDGLRSSSDKASRLSDVLVYKQSGIRITGVTSKRSDTVVVTNLSELDLFDKSSINANQGNGNYGISYYGQISSVSSGSTGRIAGVSGCPAGCENVIGIDLTGAYIRYYFGRESRNTEEGVRVMSSGMHFYNEDVRDNRSNLLRYRIYDSDLSSMVYHQETAERAECNAVDRSYASSSRWGVAGAWNNVTKTAVHVNPSAQIEIRYIAWHDGTLGQTDEETYLPALKTLLSAMGKI